MQEESSNRTRLIAIVLIVVAVFGGRYVADRSGAPEAVDETVGVLVAGPQDIERQKDSMEQAQLLTDAISTRQLQALDYIE